MWLKTQHEVLNVLSECAATSRGDIARTLNRKSDNTLKGWLVNLQRLGLVESSDQGMYRLTQAGRSIATAKYAPLANLRVLWAIQEADSAQSVEVLHRLASRETPLGSFRTILGQLKRGGYVSAQRGYYANQFRTLYALTVQGSNILERYESLRQIR